MCSSSSHSRRTGGYTRFGWAERFGARVVSEKSALLKEIGPQALLQANQLQNPDFVIALTEISGIAFLTEHAYTSHGQGSFDAPRFEQVLWEQSELSGGWVRRQSTSDRTRHFGGCYKIFRWEHGTGELAKLMQLKEGEGYTSASGEQEFRYGARKAFLSIK